MLFSSYKYRCVSHIFWAICKRIFNPAFLTDLNGSDVSPDLSAFEVANSQAPGKYRVDIIINGTVVDTKDVDFFSTAEQKQAILTRREKNLNYTHAYQQRN